MVTVVSNRQIREQIFSDYMVSNVTLKDDEDC